MRVSWNGSLSFGLVSIPVGVAPATKSAARQSDVSFRLLHRECLTPIKQKRWCPVHDCEVSGDELVEGLEVAKGQFVIVEEAELEAIERHDDSRVIEISNFIPLDAVDPVWLDRTYFLVPAQTAPSAARIGCCCGRCARVGQGRSGASSARDASRSASCGHGARHWRSRRCILAEDVYSQAEIEEAMEGTEVKAPELTLARQIVDGLTAEFDPACSRASIAATCVRCSRRRGAARRSARRNPRSSRSRLSICSRRCGRRSRRPRSAERKKPKRAAKAKTAFHREGGSREAVGGRDFA